MVKIILPGQNEPIFPGAMPMDPTWYEKLKFLEKLQPLSDIVFPPAGGVTSFGGAVGAILVGTGLSMAGQTLNALVHTNFVSTLAANVPLNNTANYFDGPFVAQGATGTWFVTGTVCCFDSTAAVCTYLAKLWDGTTILSQAQASGPSQGAASMSLSGIIANPAGNLKISVRDNSTTAGQILGTYSHITAIRIA